MSSSTTSTSTMPSATKPPFVSYSSFFASGLLAANTPMRVRRSTVSSDKHSEGSYSDFSSNDSDMDVDSTPTPDAQRRSATPTPLTLQMKAEEQDRDTTPVQSPQPASATIKSSTASTSTAPASAATPRLRRRKSSLTMAASPISAIRSSTRTAKHQQECLQKTAPAARARSGSLGGDVSYGAGGSSSPVSPGASLVYGVSGMSVGVATEGTSMVGRMRSGSYSNAVIVGVPAQAGARPRRAARRVPTAPFPAPRGAPPSAPLPAVPGLPLPATPTSATSKQPQTRANSVPATHGASGAPSVVHVKGPSVSRTSARARGLSVSSSTLSAEANWINEEQ